MFSNLTFFSNLSTVCFLKMTSNQINRYYKQYSNFFSDYEININETYAFKIKINFRDCDIGEYYLSQYLKYIIKINIMHNNYIDAFHVQKVNIL